LVARLKHSAAADDKRRDAWLAAASRTDKIEGDIAGQHQVAVIASLDKNDLRSYRDPREQMEPSRSAHHPFSHHTVVWKHQ
jgi:hypothetical protein